MNSNLYLNNIKRKSVKRLTCGPARESRIRGFFGFLLTLIDRLISVKIPTKVKGAVKISASVICVICFIGVIGGIEAEALSLANGIVLGLILTFTEVLVLKD